MYIYIYIYVYTYIHTYIYTYIHMHIFPQRAKPSRQRATAQYILECMCICTYAGAKLGAGASAQRVSV